MASARDERRRVRRRRASRRAIEPPSGAAGPIAARPRHPGRRARRPPTVQAALERFYKYLEAERRGRGRERWRRRGSSSTSCARWARAAGQALMQVLAAGNDTRRAARGRAAARAASRSRRRCRCFRTIIEKDNDLLLRRAAASGLRQLQTPESIPVMERMLDPARGGSLRAAERRRGAGGIGQAARRRGTHAHLRRSRPPTAAGGRWRSARSRT